MPTAAPEGLLGKAPVAVERLLVERREPHTARLLALHVPHRVLQRTALAVVEVEVPRS